MRYHYCLLCYCIVGELSTTYLISNNVIHKESVNLTEVAVNTHLMSSWTNEEDGFIRPVREILILMFSAYSVQVILLTIQHDIKYKIQYTFGTQPFILRTMDILGTQPFNLCRDIILFLDFVLC